eukprot:SAG11_NODE_2151_length_3742_cov_1.578644_6_plen_52_part_00
MMSAATVTVTVAIAVTVTVPVAVVISCRLLVAYLVSKFMFEALTQVRVRNH